MKFYKLKWLIYFFLYKLNRWLGGKTKWEISDERYYPPLPPLHYNCRCAIVPVRIPDDEVENYLKFREQFTKDFDKRWHGIHKRFE